MNKVAGEFKSRHIATSRESLSSLLSYYEDAYLLFSLKEFSRSLADNPRSSSKVYAVDPGLFAAFAPAAAKELGQRLETAVFDKLCRATPSIRRGSLTRLLFDEGGKQHEVDFIVGDALLGNAYLLVQVSVDISEPKTRQREVSALEAAMGKYGVAESAIVTMDSQEDIVTQTGVVHVVPAWKWLLG